MTSYPTNTALAGCRPPRDYYNECPYQVFAESTQPRERKGYHYINPQSYATDFHPIPCDLKGCSNPVYTSQDPRLIDVPRGTSMVVDTPPLDHNVKLCEIYSNKFGEYGKPYRTYSDINLGDITYYTNESRADPFYKPVFSTSAKTVSSLYQDPMGSIKPQYDRIPLNYENPYDGYKPDYDGGLSYLYYTGYQREDIMARQMRKRNQERWMPRWDYKQ